MKNKKHQNNKEPKLLGTEREGLVVSTFGATAEIEDLDGNIIRCHLRKNADPVITGDYVLWLPENNEAGVVVTHLPRKSFLARPENPRKIKPLVANIDSIIIVTSPPPVFSEDMIDRYLIAAETLQIDPVILLNKIDLLSEAEKTEMHERLAPYQKIGYEVIFSSAISDNGILQIDKYICDKTCVLVGASGVGKSSIISALTSGHGIRVGEVSASGLGKHTTTNTRLYHLSHGGNLIDSPGVREFGLWNVDKQAILDGFIEFKNFLNDCKFRDCQHLKEPGCGVQKAVGDGKINKRRYESYKKIVGEYC